MDVPHEGDEVLVRLAQERLVPPLEQVAHLRVPPVEALGIGLLEALHEAVERRRGRAEDEVHVVGHQAVSMEGHRVPRPIHGEPVEVGLVVVVTEEHRLPAIAADDDVVEESRAEHSSWSSHAALAGRVPAPGAESRERNVKVRA
jgi:hypothetical protein